MPKQKKPEKYRAVANPVRAREMHELRSSNAAGTHLDKRTRRIRTRSVSVRKAIRDHD
jgi:hypothetical protein